MRRALIALSGVAAALVVLLGANPAWGAEGEGVQGTLRLDGVPVAGVTITVFTERGTEVDSVETGEDGTWFVPVPGPGTYRVDLDQSTLPPGVVVRNGRPSLSPTVFAGTVTNVLFPLSTGTVVQPSPGETAGPSPSQPPSQSGSSNGSATFNRVIGLIYSGVHFGLIIALAALGLSLVFGTTGLTNFAHGELVTFGALMGYLFNVGFGVPAVWAAVAAVALGGGFGYVQDRYFWSWLRNRGTGLIAMMIISIGVALMLRFAYLFAVGGETERYREYVIQTPLDIGPLAVVPKVLITDAIALVVLILVALGLIFTRLGKATRAVADNAALAAASGVPVKSVVRIVWAVGGALAALAGVFLAIDQGVNYLMGVEILLLIFAAVVLGGLGTAFGALFGALIIGLFIQLSTLWVSPELKYVGALAALIVILLVRPQGLLGQRERIG